MRFGAWAIGILLCGCGYKASVGVVQTDAGEEDAGTPAVDAGPPPPRVDAGPPVGCADSPDPAPLRRMTGDEVRYALVDLFGAAPASADGFPGETAVAGYEQGVEVSAAFVERMHVVARDVGAFVAADLPRFVPCVPDSAPRDCARRFIDEFVSRRIWRALTEAPTADQLLSLYDAAPDHAAGIAALTEAALQSPLFLYRPSYGAGTDPLGPMRLTDREMATRLAAMIWRSVPDEVLLSAAVSGELSTPEQIRAQAERMLADPRAQRSVLAFTREWLDYDLVVNVVDPTLPAGLLDSFLAETDAYVTDVVLEGGGGFDTLLDGDFTFANDQLAAYYGLSGVTGSELVRVGAPEMRRSLFLHGSILATHRTPTQRGMLVRQEMLCQALPEPPPDVDLTLPEGTGTETRRERYEMATLTEPACAACHELMEPIGFALEAYDETGRYRTEDNGHPIDDSGEIVHGEDASGTVVGGPALAARLAGSSTVHQCFVVQWARYALRRQEIAEDRCMIERVTRDFESAGLDVRQMIVAFAESDGFRYRTPPAVVRTLPPTRSASTPFDQVRYDLDSLIAMHEGADRVLLEQHRERVIELEARLTP